MESFEGDVKIGRLDQFVHLWQGQMFTTHYPPGSSKGFVYEYAETSFAKMSWFKSRFTFRKYMGNTLIALIMQFDFIHSLWLIALIPTEKGLNTSKLVFFAQYPDYFIEPLVAAIEQDYNFCSILANDIFDESIEEFREELPERYTRIEKEIHDDKLPWKTYQEWPRSKQ